MTEEHFFKFDNRNDFISFVENMRDSFMCPEDWEKFFGFRLECNEDGAELETVEEYAENKCFLYEPCLNEYPVVCYTNFDSNRDRFGDFMIRIFEYISMDKLNNIGGNKNEQTEIKGMVGFTNRNRCYVYPCGIRQRGQENN